MVAVRCKVHKVAMQVKSRDTVTDFFACVRRDRVNDLAQLLKLCLYVGWKLRNIKIHISGGWCFAFHGCLLIQVKMKQERRINNKYLLLFYTVFVFVTSPYGKSENKSGTQQSQIKLGIEQVDMLFLIYT